MADKDKEIKFYRKWGSKGWFFIAALLIILSLIISNMSSKWFFILYSLFIR